MSQSKFGGLSLPEILAQTIHFMYNDYPPQFIEGGLVPEDVIRSISFICACFLAQHTNDDAGVDTGIPYEELKINERMSYEDRLVLTKKLVDDLNA